MFLSTVILVIVSLVYHILENKAAEPPSHASLANQIERRTAVRRRHVKFFLYTKDSTNKKFSKKNLEEFPRKYKNYIFIVHGWTGSRKNDWYRPMTKAILKDQENAVVQVDWSEPASWMYFTAAYYTEEVGGFIADFLTKLHQQRNTDLHKVTLVCHSLGAHVCGFAGKKVYKKLHSKIGRIIGSDPSGPLFNDEDGPNRLSKRDADCVVVLHCDRRKFGYSDSFGALDFFPNGGKAPQPGCSDSLFKSNAYERNYLIDILGCSHARAPVYLIEAFNNIWGAVGKPKPFKMLTDPKSKFLRAVSGDCGVKKGDYYFTTNHKSPYF